jgi:hypothetical protein
VLYQPAQQSLFPERKEIQNSIKPQITKKLKEDMNDNLDFGDGDILEDKIAINNAGLVLLNSFLPILFERLEFTKDASFKSKTFQLQAANYLQYLASGMTQTEEAYLTLNKVLCGIPLRTPVQDEIDITDTQKELIDGLLKAAIDYWPEIGSSSIDGFRGNWIMRDGLLAEKPERWELTVEKRAYDLLINKSPFSFSIIKFPWIKKPLYVNWPY